LPTFGKKEGKEKEGGGKGLAKNEIVLAGRPEVAVDLQATKEGREKCDLLGDLPFWTKGGREKKESLGYPRSEPRKERRWTLPPGAFFRLKGRGRGGEKKRGKKNLSVIMKAGHLPKNRLKGWKEREAERGGSLPSYPNGPPKKKKKKNPPPPTKNQTSRFVGPHRAEEKKGERRRGEGGEGGGLRQEIPSFSPKLGEEKKGGAGARQRQFRPRMSPQSGRERGGRKRKEKEGERGEGSGLSR